MSQDAYGLQRADISRVLPVALSYVASSLAEPRPRIRESASLLASTLSRTLRSSARPRSINKPCSYSFLTQGKIACEESVLQLGLVQKGAHISLVYSVHRPIYRLYFPPYIRKFTSWLAEKE